MDKSNRVPGEQALATRRDNAFNTWCDYGPDQKPQLTEFTATARFQDSFFYVSSVPRFHIALGARVYTIGSCFARNIEAELSRQKFDLPALSVPFDWSIYKRRPAYRNTVLNKYNTHSVADEIFRAIGARTYTDGGLIELRPDKWYDPATSHVDPSPRDSALALRAQLDDIQTQLLSCDVLILTLGLTETWQDLETGAIFNQFNPMTLRPLIKRMSFFNSDANESFSVLADALAALKAKAPKLNVIVTVSPVPLSHTFTSMDIVSANALSKATLRCVAQMLVEAFPFVDYYPSYEMVMNSPRLGSWQDDQLHPSRPLVEKVIGEFSKRYVKEQGGYEEAKASTSS